MNEELVKWLLTIISASLAAYVGSILALSKSKKITIWQKKQNAYLKIIESLHNILVYAEEESSSYLPVPSGNENISKKLKTRKEISLDVLRKYVHLGCLVVSKDASLKLEQLLSELYDEEFRFYEVPFHDHKAAEKISDHNFKIRKIVEKHIIELKGIASKDLKI